MLARCSHDVGIIDVNSLYRLYIFSFLERLERFYVKQNISVFVFEFNEEYRRCSCLEHLKISVSFEENHKRQQREKCDLCLLITISITIL